MSMIVLGWVIWTLQAPTWVWVLFWLGITLRVWIVIYKELSK